MWNKGTKKYSQDTKLNCVLCTRTSKGLKGKGFTMLVCLLCQAHQLTSSLLCVSNYDDKRGALAWEEREIDKTISDRQSCVHHKDGGYSKPVCWVGVASERCVCGVKLRPRKGRELHPALPALILGIEQNCSTQKTGSGKTLRIGYRMASGGREGTGEKWRSKTCIPHRWGCWILRYDLSHGHQVV